MKINMRTDYALRIVRTIYFESNNIVTSKVISQKENISNGVVMKILKFLRDADIVESHQGRGESAGGFSIKTNTEDITLYDIITIMEGPINLSFSCKNEHYALYDKGCVINKELKRVNRNLIQDLKKKSLYEIFEEKKKEEAV